MMTSKAQKITASLLVLSAVVGGVAAQLEPLFDADPATMTDWKAIGATIVGILGGWLLPAPATKK